MSQYVVKIIAVQNVTHDVKQFTIERPPGFNFTPGQATEISIKGREDELGAHPFTFTGLDDDERLEFTIKIYSDRSGLTEELGKLNPGDSLVITDAWGTISYKGPGVFLAAGAGVTPFIAIFRRLYKDGDISGNRLILSNKTEKDIIQEFSKMLGDNFINFITREQTENYENGRLDKDTIGKLINTFDQYFYVCGPGKFVKDMLVILKRKGVSSDLLVYEK